MEQLVCVSVVRVSIRTRCDVLNHPMLIYNPRAQCSLYDCAEKGAENLFLDASFPPTGLYLLFITLVKH